MDEHYPDGDKTSTFTVFGYLAAQTMEQVLRQCGDELTRENVMKQAASLKDLELGMMLPGILLNTGPDRSEEHTSELQSLMRISYAVFCLKKKKRAHHHITKTDKSSQLQKPITISYSVFFIKQ